MGGDGRPWLLDVELSRILHLAMAVARRDGVESLVLIGHVEDDERVAPALLHDAHILTIHQRLVYRLQRFHFQFAVSFYFSMCSYRHKRFDSVSVCIVKDSGGYFSFSLYS